MRGIPRQAVHANSPIKGTDRTAAQITKTNSICAWNTDMYGVDPSKPGAEEYYNSIFELYASWGVDFIKCDDIARELPQEESEMILISKALKNCGRDMVLSLSPGAALLEKAELYKDVCNMWRITDDFWDKWELLYAMFERCEKWCTHSGAGHWPDADMLPVGAILQDYDKANRTKFTEDEQITMMTLWSIFRSPLIIGGDLTQADDLTMKLLTNSEIIAMNKNVRHSHQVRRYTVNGNEFILWKGVSAADGGTYIALFNAGDSAGAADISIEDDIDGDAEIRDLWSGAAFKTAGCFTAEVPSHGARAFHASRIK